MQPTFLPWIGYFDMIDQCKDLVFLNDVDYTKNSWQNRNKIKTKKGLEWVTLPVSKNSNQKKIKSKKKLFQMILILKKSKIQFTLVTITHNSLENTQKNFLIF